MSSPIPAPRPIRPSFFALLQPGDTFMGLNLAAGGHLTHGSPVNQSGKWFKVVPYSVRADNQRIDMDEVEKLAREHKPKLILAGGSAYPRFWDFERFRAIADSVGAFFMVDMAHFAGLVAGGAHPSPLPHAHVVTTTTHKTLRGPRGGMILAMDEEIGKKINSAVFPGLQGGPLMHVIAAKAVSFGEALLPEFKQYAKAVVENAKALAETLVAGGCAITTGGTDNHLMLVDLQAEETDGPGLGRQPGTRRHHLQQERHPIRSGEAGGDLGRSPWLAGSDDPRLRHGRVPAGGPTDRARPRRARPQQLDRQLVGRARGPQRSGGIVPEVSDLWLAELSRRAIRPSGEADACAVRSAATKTPR